jgi:hypothetical protein
MPAPALRALPLQSWEWARFKQVRMHIDHHVQIEGHYYSVPHHLVGALLHHRRCHPRSPDGAKPPPDPDRSVLAPTPAQRQPKGEKYHPIVTAELKIPARNSTQMTIGHVAAESAVTFAGIRTKPQDADPVGQPGDTIEAGKVAVHWHIKQRFFHGHVAQAEPLLHEVDVQHGAQACAVTKGLGADPAKVNPNGSGISLGHPIGATGTVITVKALHELHRIGGKYALVTMCIGGGQGIAAIFERM